MFQGAAVERRGPSLRLPGKGVQQVPLLGLYTYRASLLIDSEDYSEVLCRAYDLQTLPKYVCTKQKGGTKCWVHHITSICKRSLLTCPIVLGCYL